jgi:hypothetical protein
VQSFRAFDHSVEDRGFPLDRLFKRRIKAMEKAICDVRDLVVHMDEDIYYNKVAAGQITALPQICMRLCEARAITRRHLQANAEIGTSERNTQSVRKKILRALAHHTVPPCHLDR